MSVYRQDYSWTTHVGVFAALSWGITTPRLHYCPQAKHRRRRTHTKSQSVGEKRPKSKGENTGWFIRPPGCIIALWQNVEEGAHTISQKVEERDQNLKKQGLQNRKEDI